MRLRITLEDSSYDVLVEVLPEHVQAREESVEPLPESVLRPPPPSDILPGDRICRSPIAGVVVSLAASKGEWLRQGDPVAVIEAMKMQNSIGAPLDGMVEEVLVSCGDVVKTGQILCTLS